MLENINGCKAPKVYSPHRGQIIIRLYTIIRLYVYSPHSNFQPPRKIIVMKKRPYLHSIIDAEVHEVGVAHSVQGGDDDVLHFRLLVPEADVLDGIVPVDPPASSFKLHKNSL